METIGSTCPGRTGVEFMGKHGGGPGVRLRKHQRKKS